MAKISSASSLESYLSEESCGSSSSCSLENNAGSSASSLNGRQTEAFSTTSIPSHRFITTEDDTELIFKGNTSRQDSRNLLLDHLHHSLTSAAVLNKVKKLEKVQGCKEDNYEIEEIFVSDDSARISQLSNESVAASVNFKMSRHKPTDHDFQDKVSNRAIPISSKISRISPPFLDTVNTLSLLSPHSCKKSLSCETKDLGQPKALPYNKSFPTSRDDINERAIPKRQKRLKINKTKDMRIDHMTSPSKAGGDVFKMKIEKSKKLDSTSNYNTKKERISCIEISKHDALTMKNVSKLLQNTLDKDSLQELTKNISDSSCSTISSVDSNSSGLSQDYKINKIKNPFLKKKLSTELLFESWDARKFGLLKSLNPMYHEVNSAYDSIIHLIETDMMSCAIRWFLFKKALFSENATLTTVPFPPLFVNNDVPDVKYLQRFVKMNPSITEFSTDDSVSIQFIHWILTVNSHLEYVQCTRSGCVSILTQVNPVILSLTPHFMFHVKSLISPLADFPSQMTLFCPCLLSRLFTIINGNMNLLTLSCSDKKGVFGFNSMKKCIKFIVKKLAATQNSHHIGLTSEIVTKDFESFAILVIEMAKHVDMKDIYCDKFDGKICFIEKPFDSYVKYVLLYETGTYEKVMRNLNEDSTRDNSNNEKHKLKPRRLLCHLLLSVGLALLTSVLVYFGYVKPYFELVKQREIELEMELARQKNKSWTNFWR